MPGNERIDEACIAFLNAMKPRMDVKLGRESKDPAEGFRQAPESERDILRSGLRAAFEVMND